MKNRSIVWYAEIGGRYFTVERDMSRDPWFVYEIDKDGEIVGDSGSIALCFNLQAARGAITDHLAGMNPEEVSTRAITAPPAGTGRNHPKHVERRRSWQR